MSTAFLIDPAFTHSWGHHAAILSGLVHAAQLADQEVRIFAHCEGALAAIEGHGVAKVFSGRFHSAAPDDCVDAHVDLRRRQSAFRDELGRCLAQVSRSDCIHLAHATLVTLNGMAAWASGMPGHLRPRLVVYLVSLPPERDELSVALGSPHHLVCAIDRLRGLFGNRFELVVIAPSDCAYLEGRNCGPALYLPYMALRKPLAPLVRPPTAQAPLVFVAGHFGAEEGIDLVLPTIQRLADDGLDVRWLVAGQTFDPDAVYVDASTGQFRSKDRVAFARDVHGLDDYDDVIRSADLILLPDSPLDYEERGSVVADEAEALGIPYVAPKVRFSFEAAANGAAERFDQWTVDSIADAIARAVARLPEMTRSARAFAQVRYAETSALRDSGHGKLFSSEDAVQSVLRPDAVDLPAVDVVVTLHNYWRFLPLCLRSVERQSYPNWRCIVVDDGSSDVEFDELRALVARFGERFSLVQHAAPLGQLEAVATGLSMGANPFVILLDADDELTDTALDLHVSWHLNGSVPVAMTSGRMMVMDERGALLAGHCDHLAWEERKGPHLFKLEADQAFRRVDAKFEAPPAIFVNQRTSPPGAWYWSPTSGLMFRRSMMELLVADRFDLGKLAADTYFGYGAHAFGGSLLIEAPVARYRRHGGNGLAGRRLYGSGTLPVPQDYPDWQRIALQLRAFIENDPKRFYDQIAYDIIERFLSVAPSQVKPREVSPVQPPKESSQPVIRAGLGRYVTRQKENRLNWLEAVTFETGGMGSTLLRSGWSRPEGWGAWSIGPRAILSWDLGSMPAGPVLVLIACRIYPPDGRVDQVVRVHANGTEIGVLRRTSHGAVAEGIFAMASEIVGAETPLKLVFEIEKPTSPHERGEGTDTRKLGIGLTAMRLGLEQGAV